MLKRFWYPIPAVCLLCLAAREPAIEYRFIAAAAADELTPSLGGGSPRGYSPLNGITRENVGNLGVAWIYHSRDLNPGDNPPGLESSGLFAGGVLFTPTAGDAFVALDGSSGRELWRFKPEGHPAVRGLLEHEGRIYFSSGDSLYVLEAKTGKQVMRFAARATVAPAIYRDILIVPCWNIVRAFDLASGKPLWSFNLIAEPSNGLTWGANSWGGIALDEQRGIAYVSTGSPHPNFLGMNHPGDNLYADSVVALKADTGEYLWHFQEVRHDVWDWDIPAAPNLVTVTRDGRQFDAVAQVTKIGNTLLLDRVTGKPLFPVRLRRAPQSGVPGETLAEWQPDIDIPEPFTRQAFSPDQVTDAFVRKKIADARFGWFLPIAKEKKTIWYSSLGGAEWTGASFDPTRQWLFVNANDFPCWSTAKEFDVPAADNKTSGGKLYTKYCAACHGEDRTGVSAPSLLPLIGRGSMSNVAQIVQHGYRSMPAAAVLPGELPILMSYLSAPVRPSGKSVLQAVWLGRVTDQKGYPGVKPPWGTLNAINLNTGRIEWKVPLGEYEELTRARVPITGTENFGATIVTASGIVFCAGTPDRKIRAFDAESGKQLWEYKLPFAAYAPPVTYEAGGKQYLAIASTGGGKLNSPLGDAYIAFAIPRDVTPASPPPRDTARFHRRY